MMLHRREEWSMLPRGQAKEPGDFALCECGMEVRVPHGTSHYEAWSRHFAAAISVVVNSYIEAERKFNEIEERLTAALDSPTEGTGREIVVSRPAPCQTRPSLPDGSAQGRGFREISGSERPCAGRTLVVKAVPLLTSGTDLRRFDPPRSQEPFVLDPEIAQQARMALVALFERMRSTVSAEVHRRT